MSRCQKCGQEKIEKSFFEHDPLSGNCIIKKEICPVCDSPKNEVKNSPYFTKKAGIELFNEKKEEEKHGTE